MAAGRALPGALLRDPGARDDLGGTWDLFRYPGVRSDSDMFSFAYPFQPWRGSRSLPDGASIRQYIADTAHEAGIDRRIRFATRVVSAEWSSANDLWTVHAEVGPERTPRRYACSWLHLCSGYYDYDRGHAPELPGSEDFAGQIVHPQAWPEALDWTGRRVVVIGSGATAVTLVPALAEGAAHVTMLQRSPTYLTALPPVDRWADAVRRRLPAQAAHTLIRTRNVTLSQGFYQLCRRRPALARRLLRHGLERYLDDPAYLDAHFTPTYEPWDQRVCVMPDGDLLRAIASGRASVVTDRITRLEPTGVRLASGALLEADLLITATGLRLLPVGGIGLSVDGRAIDPAAEFAHRGIMLSGVPNMSYCLGYTNASWTLRADLVSGYLCRMLRHLRRHGIAAVAPVRPAGEPGRPLIDMSSGYIQRAAHLFPRQGRRDPWTVGQNYLVDRWRIPHADLLDGMRILPRPETRTP